MVKKVSLVKMFLKNYTGKNVNVAARKAAKAQGKSKGVMARAKEAKEYFKSKVEKAKDQRTKEKKAAPYESLAFKAKRKKRQTKRQERRNRGIKRSIDQLKRNYERIGKMEASKVSRKYERTEEKIVKRPKMKAAKKKAKPKLYYQGKDKPLKLK